MTDNSTVQDNNQQILNDIQSLQTMEQQLVNSLESNPSLTSEQQQQIIDKINQISNMRINLYKTLSGVNSFFQTALNSSQNTLKEQTEVVAIVENELNKSKSQLQLLQAEKNNKIRLVEINNYYGEKYAEHASLMKIIIFILVPVILLTILYNNDILPSKIFYILIVIISAIGGYYLGKTYISIFMRDTMNYEEYDWYFNPKTAPSVASSSVTGDPWLSTNLLGTCIGQECCSTGQLYDSSLNQCITNITDAVSNGVNEISSSGNIISNSTVSNYNSNNVTESFVNSVLTKSQQKYKMDVNLKGNNILPHTSESFINFFKFK
jgi:hypothetical protein